jgi:hypothetical protein
MKKHGGLETVLLSFLTSILDADQMSRLIYLRSRASGTYRVRGWVCCRIGLDDVGKRKIFNLGIEP